MAGMRTCGDNRFNPGGGEFDTPCRRFARVPIGAFGAGRGSCPAAPANRRVCGGRRQSKEMERRDIARIMLLQGAQTRTMQTNQAGLNLIKEFEGLCLHAYQDVVGVWTIGYGHTGPEVKEGLAITEHDAEQLLRGDLLRFESGVAAAVDVPLNENQFSALVSFSYNLGLGSLQKSTLLSQLNEGNHEGAAEQFPLWDKAGGRSLPGLHKRRLAEKALFQTPVEG